MKMEVTKLREESTGPGEMSGRRHKDDDFINIAEMPGKTWGMDFQDRIHDCG